MISDKSYKSLQDVVDANSDLVSYFFNETLSPHASARHGLSPVPIEVTNWRDEQRAWREAVLLVDQSHHMPEMFLKGPDALRLLSDTGVNSFANFPPLRAKQFVACGYDGHVIGECVLQHIEQGTYELISGMFVQEWLRYRAETGGYDVDITLDPATAWNPGKRTFYRYQLDGPFAQSVFDEAVEGATPDIKFFHMAKVRIAGCDVNALRHGMAGHKGVELSGPLDEGEAVLAELLRIGAKYSMRRGGLKTYFSTPPESGWVGYPPPALYSDPRLKPFREWLGPDSWAAQIQFGGSFRSSNIEDYYRTVWDLGLEKLVKFDHDFIGREALETMFANGGGRRRRVSLVWEEGEFARVMGSLVGDELPFKYVELPMANYAFQQSDEVRNADGEVVGISNFTGYTTNEQKMISIACVNAEDAVDGKELALTWGEPEGGSRKARVERHRQTAVRVRVAPVPYSKQVQMLKNSAMAKAAA